MLLNEMCMLQSVFRISYEFINGHLGVHLLRAWEKLLGELCGFGFWGATFVERV